MTLNQLTAVDVYWSPVTKESEVPKTSMKPDEKFYLDKRYYPGVYVFLDCNK